MSDDETTPTDALLCKPATHEARAIADLALALAAVAVDIGTSAGRLDELAGAKRAIFLGDLALKLGQVGDALHDARRVVTNMIHKEQTP